MEPGPDELPLRRWGLRFAVDTAHGRHANLAARLQSHAEPPRILVSQATWLLVQAQVPCVARGEVSLKGIHKPVAVYEIAEAPEPALQASGTSTVSDGSNRAFSIAPPRA